MKRAVRGVAAAAAMAAGMVLLPGQAQATPISLTVPGGTAFTVLGHWCGGIFEHVFATTFATKTGYPMGDAYIWTTCSGSGRGGHPTTYSAWLGMTWDFTGAMVSYTTLTGTPTVNPTLSIYDSHGNHLYNSSNAAYLDLAPGFVPAPRVAGVSPTSAPQGTTVTITGTGFTGATAVNFGTIASAGFTVNSDTSVTAVAPAVRTGTVNITVTGPGGTSLKTTSDLFTFTLTPRIASISPTTGSADGGTKVTITGVNFTGASAVDFGGVPATFHVVNGTTITALSPSVPDPVTVDVTVTSSYGTSVPTTSDQYTYF